MSVKVKPASSRQRQTDAPGNLSLAEAQLRQAAVRVTEARVKVLAALLGAERAMSHQDVQDSFAEMDRVTLYRALDCLTDAGLAHKIPGDDRVFRYSAGTDHGEHASGSQHGHFKCMRCSKVFCLDGPAEAQALQEALQKTLGMLGRGFRSHELEFTIKGWCADCAQ
jgi:Fur family ferric uptake transcriptional regulator